MKMRGSPVLNTRPDSDASTWRLGGRRAGAQQLRRAVAHVLPQHARLRVVQRERRKVGAAAAPQCRRDRPEQRPRVELRDDRVGDVEQQIQLIALALQRRPLLLDRLETARVLERDGHQRRHAAHQLDILWRVGVAFERSEVERSDRAAAR